MNLMDWLVKRYPLAKRQTLRRMVEEGRVIINDQRARSLKHEVADADRVQVRDRPADEQPGVHPLSIVHEDEDLLVVFKPAGILTATVVDEVRPNAVAMLRQYLEQTSPRSRLGIVHRLDRDASGLLVFSKSHEAHRSLKQQFFEHTVDRTYTAVTHGVPNPRHGRIRSRLVELPDGTVRTSRRPDGGREAITEYRVISAANGRALVEVRLQTGRKHQIRAHLAERGCPIVGDRLYGKTLEPGVRLMLAATGLAIAHPRTGQRMTFSIEPPKAMAQVMESAG